MALSVVLVFSPRPREVIEWALTVEQGCTVAQVLTSAECVAALKDSGFATAGVGVWGRKVSPSCVLRDQDRLELYRKLTVDPKVARRERFVRQGAKKAAGLFAKRRTGAKAGY